MATPAPTPTRPATPPLTTSTRPVTPQATQPVPRAPTPPAGIPVQRQGTPPGEAERRNTPPGGIAAQPRPTPVGTARPGTPPAQRSGTPDPINPPTNRGRIDPLSPPTQRGAVDPLNPPTNRGRVADPVNPPTNRDPLNPPTARFAGAAQPSGARAAVGDEQSELRHAMDLLSSKDWSGARLAFHALAAKVPQSRQYRALLCYSRGRETQATGRADDALMEYQRALQLDPDLQLAKDAIREVQRKSRW
jgi:hypothetical protein